MIKDITIGQYFPGNSPLHRLDPRTKLILTVLYIVILFMAKSMLSFVLVVLFTLTLIPVSGISFKIILKSLKPLIFIIVFTMTLNLFFTKGEGEPLLSFWKINIYKEGVSFAVYMIVRIICLIAGTGVILTYTTSPIQLTDGIEQLLAPLAKIKLPVHEFAMMMSCALRFIPTLVEETDKIMSAQKARGADFTSGSLVRRARAIIPILIPLFVSAFRRADELAVAMECRCYHGGEGRTRMNSLRFSARDLAAAVVFISFGAAVVLLNIFAGGIGIGI